MEFGRDGGEGLYKGKKGMREMIYPRVMRKFKILLSGQADERQFPQGGEEDMLHRSRISTGGGEEMAPSSAYRFSM